MLKVFGKSILNGVFEQIHLSTDKKYLKYQNTKYSICSISNTKYKKYFKYVFEIQVFHILPTSAPSAPSLPPNYQPTYEIKFYHQITVLQNVIGSRNL